MAIANKYDFYINGNGPYRAKAIKQTNESLAGEDSGRTDDGVMHITWLKRKLRKWEIELPPGTSTDIYNIMHQVQGEEYNITIFDISTNSSQTVAVYTSNTAAECYSGVVQTGGLYTGAAFSAIEKG